jgi:trk system potassium uptake protein TrkA
VVTKIDDPEFEHICVELGLADSLVPMHTVGRYLADLAEGQDIIELSDILRGDARIFSFTVSDVEANTIDALELPCSAQAICIYRNGNELNFAAPDTLLTPGDEVVVLARAEGPKELHERFGLNKKLDVRVG